jgi:hypothetical protein
MTRLMELSRKLDDLIEFTRPLGSRWYGRKIPQEVINKKTAAWNQARLKAKRIQARERRYHDNPQSLLCPGCFHRNPTPVAECANCGAVL